MRTTPISPGVDELAYYDTTSTYLECDEPGDEPAQYGLRQRGYSRDLRPDSRQIVTADPAPFHKASEGLMVKAVTVEKQRVVVCFSPESAECDLKLRTGALERMRPVLDRYV